MANAKQFEKQSEVGEPRNEYIPYVGGVCDCTLYNRHFFIFKTQITCFKAAMYLPTAHY